MTTGQLLFYSGAALLAVTIILAVIFWKKKPEYHPENAVYEFAGMQKTQKLRSPSAPTAQQPPEQETAKATELMETSLVETELMPEDAEIRTHFR